MRAQRRRDLRCGVAQATPTLLSHVCLRTGAAATRRRGAGAGSGELRGREPREQVAAAAAGEE